jgi:putative membrane protein
MFLRLVCRAAIVTGTAAAAVAIPHASRATAHPRGPGLDDATIAAIFDAANTRDIESATLATHKAAHADVRELARTFVHDHRAVRQQGRDLAARLHVKPPASPAADSANRAAHAAAMRQLRALSGDAFDRAWLAHEVAYHRAVIDAVQKTLLPAVTNPELKAFVQQVAPAFQGHLAAAERLAQKYGPPSGQAAARTSP